MTSLNLNRIGFFQLTLATLKRLPERLCDLLMLILQLQDFLYLESILKEQDACRFNQAIDHLLELQALIPEHSKVELVRICASIQPQCLLKLISLCTFETSSCFWSLLQETEIDAGSKLFKLEELNESYWNLPESGIDETMKSTIEHPKGKMGVRKEIKELVCFSCKYSLITSDQQRSITMFPCGHLFHDWCLGSQDLCIACCDRLFDF